MASVGLLGEGEEEGGEVVLIGISCIRISIIHNLSTSGTTALTQDFIIKDGAYKYRSIFARFMTMRKKQILARANGIQKENWE